ncbi:type IV secretory system conjugative DNA transfer family protein [Seohaeicola saemankumensis]|nr:type IV secretory system conjugative DNA transfer family protein [Seohaeicola saemankumensis]MCA0869282.1 type IV secretory system conjugative DNA transfer family protein [Seohaeicola saemankumensis]
MGFLLTLGALAVFGTAVLVAAYLFLPVAIIGGSAGLVGYWWINGSRPREWRKRRETRDLYEEILENYQNEEPEWNLPADVIPVANHLFDTEVGGGQVPPPPLICDSIEGARYRDKLRKLGSVNPERAREAVSVIEEAFGRLDYPASGGEFKVPIRYVLRDLPRALENMLLVFAQADGFHDLTNQIDKNFQDVKEVYPTDYKHDDIVEVYTKGTPLGRLFDLEVPFSIPREKYYQHGLITAGTGGGKSQLVQWFVGREYDRLRDGEVSVIVMDSQKDLIDALLNLDLPKERVCYLNPSDIEYPVPISLFDLGMARKSEYSAADQERVVNKAIEVLSFVIDSVLGAEMTTKQSTLFNYLIRLLIEIPDATLHTMREILKEGGHEPYSDYIDNLSRTAQEFFYEQYDNYKQYGQTREQVMRRIFDVLEVGVFERMFSHAQTKFDLFEEMQEGKLILLDTEKSLLQGSGTELLGRLYLAMLNSAIQERALIQDRKPVYFFCDEARDYVQSNSDSTISDMLEQARKMNVGTFWVTQHLGQIDMKMRGSFMANTAIKMVSNPSHDDATRFAREMNTRPDFIRDLPALTFATFVKGQTATAVPVSIPYGALSKLPQRDDREELRDYLRAKYSVTPDPDTTVHGAGFTMERDPWDVPEDRPEDETPYGTVGDPPDRPEEEPPGADDDEGLRRFLNTGKKRRNEDDDDIPPL